MPILGPVLGFCSGGIPETWGPTLYPVHEVLDLFIAVKPEFGGGHFVTGVHEVVGGDDVSSTSTLYPSPVDAQVWLSRGCEAVNNLSHLLLCELPELAIFGPRFAVISDVGPLYSLSPQESDVLLDTSVSFLQPECVGDDIGKAGLRQPSLGHFHGSAQGDRSQGQHIVLLERVQVHWGYADFSIDI